MIKLYLPIVCISLSILTCTMQSEQSTDKQKGKEVKEPSYALVIHGGAGTFQRAKKEKGVKERYIQSMQIALNTGQSILENGGSSLDAVEAVIRTLEDDSLFNAGKGSVMTHEGTIEMDASIMEGSDLKAGAVGGVRTIKNPITVARSVMEDSKHVMLVGRGAEKFAEMQQLDLVERDYFKTGRSEERLKERRSKEDQGMGKTEERERQEKLGTVGAVALDMDGNIAAGTSTGGMTNKKWGRIGDSPIIGAGTYADNRSCGVSCTGHGEYFIRYAVAHDLSARMRYGGVSLSEAANSIIHDELKSAGGSGGLIALDREGNITMEFNTSAMLRAHATPDSTSIKIFPEE